MKIGGEGGIRTHEGLHPNGFQVRRLQPGSATSPAPIIAEEICGPAPICRLEVSGRGGMLLTTPSGESTARSAQVSLEVIHREGWR